MTPLIIDDVAMGPTVNLQGGIRCFSLATGKILNLQWKDVQILTMPLSAISRIKRAAKNKNSIKALKCGDRQKIIDQIISTGVENDPISDNN